MTNTPDDQVRETTVGGILREAAERAASTVALVEGGGDRRWDYSDLLAGAEQVARALLGRFAPGERVAIWAPNSPEWLLTEFGAALAGLTLVTVNPALRAAEAGHVLAQSRAQGVVLAPSYRGADLAATLEQIRGDLPSLREVISLAGWDGFVRTASAAERLPASARMTWRRSSTPRVPQGSPRAPCCVIAGSPTTAGSARRSWRPGRVRSGSTRCRCSIRQAACCSPSGRSRACSPRSWCLGSTPAWCSG